MSFIHGVPSLQNTGLVQQRQNKYIYELISMSQKNYKYISRDSSGLNITLKNAQCITLIHFFIH